jgi:TonB-dependent receptor
VNDYVILRAAYSKTLTRPNLNDLSPGIITPQEVRLSNLTGDGGNPELEPYESENWDFSSEFYFGETTLFSLGLFNKKIEGFIVRGGALEAITVPEPNSLDTITEDRTNINGNDITFEITRPRNLEGTSAYGAEISFQHTFDYLPSFLQYVGVNANLTYVRSSDEFDTSNADNSVVLPGLGDSKNFVLFYDDGRIEARLAFNDREKFFTRLLGVEPVFTEQYDQLDARIAWNINESYQVFVEGTNLTESYTRQVGRFDTRFAAVESPGARYTIGVRANF